MVHSIDVELRYNVRAKMQRLSEQSEQIHELRDQINKCLDNPNPQCYKKITDILDVLSEVTKQNKLLIEDIQDDIARMRKERLNQ